MTSHEDLTDEQIIERVAVEVMQWHPDGKMWKENAEPHYVRGHTEDVCYDGDEYKAWNPLTDWNHTMEVVEKLRAEGWAFNYGASGGEQGRGFSLWGMEKTGGYFPSDPGTITVVKESGQRAILLAALQAVRSKV